MSFFFFFFNESTNNDFHMKSAGICKEIQLYSSIQLTIYPSIHHPSIAYPELFNSS